MRIAFISDIHGNLTALEAVLADINKNGTDQIICLGDTISLGPQPLETLNVLKELNCIYIMGNHDEAILDPEKAPELEITEHLVPDLYWCRDQLVADSFEFLKSFQGNYKIEFPNGVQLLAFHGSPNSTTDIIQATTSSELLDEYFAEQSSTVFIGGH